MEKAPENNDIHGVSTSIAFNSSSDYITFYPIQDFLLKDNNNEFINFDKIILDKNENDCFIVNSTNEFEFLSDYQNKMYIPTSFTENDNENYLIISQNYFNQIQKNMFVNNATYIITPDGGFSKIIINNENCQDQNSVIPSLINGNLPENDNEIVITKQICSYYSLDINEVIGKEIELEFVGRTIYNQNIYEKETIKFIITGVSDTTTFFSSNMRDYILDNYGFSSLKNGIKSITFKNYNLNTFIFAFKNNLIPQDEIENTIEGMINIIDNMKYFIIGLALIFIIISLIIFINSIESSLNKSKKEIGILLIFNIEKKYIFFPFVLETIIIILISSILSIPFYVIANNLINNYFSQQFEILINILKFNPISLLIIVISLIIFIIITTMISIKKLNKYQRIDLLKS
jgi:ABC-type antimicrobial peptide transport system permease subunit